MEVMLVPLWIALFPLGAGGKRLAAAMLHGMVGQGKLNRFGGFGW